MGTMSKRMLQHNEELFAEMCNRKKKAKLNGGKYGDMCFVCEGKKRYINRNYVFGYSNVLRLLFENEPGTINLGERLEVEIKDFTPEQVEKWCQIMEPSPLGYEHLMRNNMNLVMGLCFKYDTKWDSFMKIYDSRTTISHDIIREMLRQENSIFDELLLSSITKGKVDIQGLYESGIISMFSSSMMVKILKYVMEKNRGDTKRKKANWSLERSVNKAKHDRLVKENKSLEAENTKLLKELKRSRKTKSIMTKKARDARDARLGIIMRPSEW